MSRIGKKPIVLPAGVTATYNNGTVTVTGSKGTLTRTIDTVIGCHVEGNEITFSCPEKADGSVQFDAIPFDKAGTYEYTIEELNDKQKGITYDTKVHHVTIKVTDDENGFLKAEVTGDKAVFTNSYDDGGLMGMVVLFLSACGSLAVTLRKKRA